jgi:sugar phosphate isomerase/epimerase
MASLGLLSPEFPSVSLSANLDAIAATGAVSVQFDLASAVSQTFASELSQDAVDAINAGFSARQLTLAALSGTYNMIDPDPKAREAGAEGLNRVIALAPRLGTNVVTLCTGSRDTSNMWRRHPDNDTP